MNNTIENIPWEDSYLDEIVINYSKIIIKISSEYMGLKKIVCEEFISIKYIGQWDENIINTIDVTSNSDFINESLQLVKDNYLNTEIIGCNKHINDNWLQLRINLIDNVNIIIVCKNINII